MPRRNPFLGVGAGDISIPYDQSGGISMPGMQVPEPGGSMRKMQFEFSDPAEQQMQAQQAQMQSAGIPPAGAGGGQQPPANAMPPMGQGAPQDQAGSMFGAMAPPPNQMGQGGESAMFSDDQLAALLGDGQSGPMSPIDIQADALEQQLANDPEMQMQMMMAARRMGGF
jgi:hypothetical protein